MYEIPKEGLVIHLCRKNFDHDCKDKIAQLYLVPDWYACIGTSGEPPEICNSDNKPCDVQSYRLVKETCWRPLKRIEKQERIFERVWFWVMLFVGAAMVAVGVKAFRLVKVLLAAEDIAEVREAVPWAMVGSFAIAMSGYLLMKHFDVVTWWLAERMKWCYRKIRG